jgi:hypothetical protein
MIIQRQSRTYFAPDDATALDATGSWSALPHAKLLPIDIKALQDQVAQLRLPPLPDDAALLAWAKQNHPAVPRNAQADVIQKQAAAAWTDYQTKMKAQGVVVPDVAPQYGGQ